MKHNKKRNTAFIYETLSRELTKAIVDKNDNKKKVVLEGGAIDVNGKGVLITTEECLLSTVQQRNPGLNKDDYEKLFLNNKEIKVLRKTREILLPKLITGELSIRDAEKVVWCL